MPLPIAHGLLGASVIAALLPAPASIRYVKPMLFGAFLANLADADFFLVLVTHSAEWHRGFTHSMAAALFVTALFVIYFGKNRLREGFAYGTAYASHFVLDYSTTREGGGLELFFPFTSQKYALDWFGISEVPSRMSLVELGQALIVEFAIFSALLILVLVIKNNLTERKLTV